MKSSWLVVTSVLVCVRIITASNDQLPTHEGCCKAGKLLYVDYQRRTLDDHNQHLIKARGIPESFVPRTTLIVKKHEEEQIAQSNSTTSIQNQEPPNNGTTAQNATHTVRRRQSLEDVKNDTVKEGLPSENLQLTNITKALLEQPRNETKLEKRQIIPQEEALQPEQSQDVPPKPTEPQELSPQPVSPLADVQEPSQPNITVINDTSIPLNRQERFTTFKELTKEINRTTKRDTTSDHNETSHEGHHTIPKRQAQEFELFASAENGNENVTQNDTALMKKRDIPPISEGEAPPNINGTLTNSTLKESNATLELGTNDGITPEGAKVKRDFGPEHPKDCERHMIRKKAVDIGCTCALFNTETPSETDTPIISESFQNVTCHDRAEGEQTCAELCVNLTKNSSRSIEELACFHLGHAINVNAFLSTKLCGDSGKWMYTGVSTPNAICCHMGEVVDCSDPALLVNKP